MLLVELYCCIFHFELLEEETVCVRSSNLELFQWLLIFECVLNSFVCFVSEILKSIRMFKELEHNFSISSRLRPDF